MKGGRLHREVNTLAFVFLAEWLIGHDPEAELLCVESEGAVLVSGSQSHW